VSKLSLALVSLVAAIPGGFLIYLLVMAFLSHANDMSGTLKIVAAATLGATSFISLMPLGILLLGKKAPGEKKKKAKKGKKGDASETIAAAAVVGDMDVAEGDVDVDSTDMVSAVDDFDSSEFASGEFESSEFEIDSDGEEVVVASSDMISSAEDFESSELEIDEAFLSDDEVGFSNELIDVNDISDDSIVISEEELNLDGAEATVDDGLSDMDIAFTDLDEDVSEAEAEFFNEGDSAEFNPESLEINEGSAVISPDELTDSGSETFSANDAGLSSELDIDLDEFDVDSSDALTTDIPERLTDDEGVTSGEYSEFELELEELEASKDDVDKSYFESAGNMQIGEDSMELHEGALELTESGDEIEVSEFDEGFFDESGEIESTMPPTVDQDHLAATYIDESGEDEIVDALPSEDELDVFDSLDEDGSGSAPDLSAFDDDDDDAIVVMDAGGKERELKDDDDFSDFDLEFTDGDEENEVSEDFFIAEPDKFSIDKEEAATEDDGLEEFGEELGEIEGLDDLDFGDDDFEIGDSPEEAPSPMNQTIATDLTNIPPIQKDVPEDVSELPPIQGDGIPDLDDDDDFPEDLFLSDDEISLDDLDLDDLDLDE
jgi:hypothetical protein